MTKNDWLKMEYLTSEEANELLARVHDQMVEMENKNDWDASVNEEGFQVFLYQSFFAMLEEIEKDVGEDLGKYQYFPKINDFWHYAEYIAEVHCSVDDARDDFHKTYIYELVEEWWHLWF